MGRYYMGAGVCTEHIECHTLPRRSSRLKIAGQVPCSPNQGGTCWFTLCRTFVRQHHWESIYCKNACLTSRIRAAIIRAMPPPRVVTTYTILLGRGPTPKL